MTVFLIAFGILGSLQVLAKFEISEIKPSADTSPVNRESFNIEAAAVRKCAIISVLVAL